MHWSVWGGKYSQPLSSIEALIDTSVHARMLCILPKLRFILRLWPVDYDPHRSLAPKHPPSWLSWLQKLSQLTQNGNKRMLKWTETVNCSYKRDKIDYNGQFNNKILFNGVMRRGVQVIASFYFINKLRDHFEANTRDSASLTIDTGLKYFSGLYIKSKWKESIFHL